MVLVNRKLNLKVILKNPIIQVIIVYLLWLRVGIIDEGKLYGFVTEVLKIRSKILLTYVLNPDNIYYIFHFIAVTILACNIFFEHSFEKMGLKKGNINEEVKLLVRFVIIFIGGFSLVSQLISGYMLTASYIIVVVITQFCFVALVEESTFRGFICYKLFESAKDKKMLYFMFVLSAVLFAFMHLPSFLRSGTNITFFQIVNRLFNPFIMGIWFGIMYYYKRNLYICMIWHGSYNLIFSVVFGKMQSICYMAFIIISIIYLMKTIEQSTVKKGEI